MAPKDHQNGPNDETGRHDSSAQPLRQGSDASSVPGSSTDEPNESDELLEGALLPIISKAATPPASLRARILAALRPQTFAFVMRNEGPWLPHADAPIAIKELLADSRDRLATRLIRFQSAGALPQPPLAGRRALYVVNGSIAQSAERAPLGAGGFRDEYPAQPWSAAGGTLLLEFSEHVAGPARERTIAGADAAWFDALPGGRVRPLEGGDDGPRSFLVLSMSPGSTLPSHPHHGVEELYVLAGSCTLDGRTLSAGDYHRAAAQSTHPDTQTLDDGCEVLVVLRDPDRLAAGEIAV